VTGLAVNVTVYMNYTAVEQSSFGPNGYYDFGYEVFDPTEVKK
jgi:hypothetical protein